MPEVRESAAPEIAADVAVGNPAADILRAAYPADRERQHAVRVLAWLAWQMPADRGLAWWDIPAWVGARAVRFARRLIGAAILGIGFAAGFAGFVGLPGLVAGIFAALGAWYLGKRLKAGRLLRRRPPQAMVPRWPRSVWEMAILAIALLTGVFVRRTLISMWARPVADTPSATPRSSYRACMWSTLIDGAACLLTGAPVVVVALALGATPLLAVAGVLAGIAVLAALADGSVPAVWEAELAVLIQNRRRVRFHRMLEDAVDREILQPEGAYYGFRDADVRDYLAGVVRSAVGQKNQRIAERRWRIAERHKRFADAAAAAKPGFRPWLLRLLSDSTVIRIAVDVGCGAAVAAIVRLAMDAASGGGVTWSSPSDIGIGALEALATGAFGTGLLLNRLAYGLGWSLWLTARLSRSVQVAVPAAVVGMVGVLTLAIGPATVRHGVAVFAVTLMPAADITVLGSWVCVLAHRRWRAARHRLVRHAADALLAGVTAVAILTVVDRGLLGAQGAAGLLFPVAVWLSILGWRAMNDSRNRAVRAVADIAVSLMLGITLVLLLVWLANLLHMPSAEVAILRDTLDHIGKAVDQPWWTWTGLYVLLAGASLAFALWPGRLARMTRGFSRLRVVPLAVASRRVLTGVHIGLLVIALIGLAVPAAVGPALRARLTDRYTQTLVDNLRARGELAAYQEITREFPLLRPSLLAALADVLIRIDDFSKPSDGKRGATPVELDLAMRIGELQAATLAPRPPDVVQTEDAAARQAGFDTPPADATQESKRLAELDSAEKQDDATERLVDQAAELAAGAVANALQLPGLGDAEILQVIKEYLSGLIENSPLKDVFAGWAGRIPGRSGDAPPSAAKLMVPDPGLLKTAVHDLQEGTPCDGCAQPERSGDEHGSGSDEHPIEPDFGW